MVGYQQRMDQSLWWAPTRVFQVPLWVTGDMGGLVVGEGLVSVRVLDMSFPGIGGLIVPMAEDVEFDLLNLFHVSDPAAHPDFQDLRSQVRHWIDTELGERSDFTADEAEHHEVEGTPKAMARAKASTPDGTTEPGRAPGGARHGQKKPTVAGLAQQLDVVMNALPMITDQLTNLAMQQAAIQKQMGVPKAQVPSSAEGFKAMAPEKAPMPISSMLARPPQGATASVARLVGIAPRTKGLSKAMPAALVPSKPWEPVRRDGGRQRRVSRARALLEQSKALAALVSHFHASATDPLSDLSTSTPAWESRALRQESVCRRSFHSIQRRMSPTETGDVSLLAYLERYGGYGQNRELGAWYGSMVRSSRIRCYGRGRLGPRTIWPLQL